MHGHDTGPFGAGSTYEAHRGSAEDPGRHSAFSLVALIAVVAIAGALLLGLVFLILGTLLSIAGAILKIAIIAAIAAFVWRRVMRRCDRG